MKNKIIVIFCMILISSFVFAQSNQKLNMTSYFSPKKTQIFSDNGYSVNIYEPYYAYSHQHVMNFKIINSLEISTGLDFSNYKYYTNTYEVVGLHDCALGDPSNCDIYYYYYFYHIKYISIPVNLTYTPFSWKISPYISFGTLFSFPYWSKRFKTEDEDYINSEYFFGLLFKSDESVDKYNFDPSIFLHAQAGLKLNMNLFNIFAGIDANYQLRQRKEYSNLYSLGPYLGIDYTISRKKTNNKN